MPFAAFDGPMTTPLLAPRTTPVAATPRRPPSPRAASGPPPRRRRRCAAGPRPRRTTDPARRSAEARTASSRRASGGASLSRPCCYPRRTAAGPRRRTCAYQVGRLVLRRHEVMRWTRRLPGLQGWREAQAALPCVCRQAVSLQKKPSGLVRRCRARDGKRPQSRGNEASCLTRRARQPCPHAK